MTSKPTLRARRRQLRAELRRRKRAARATLRARRRASREERDPGRTRRRILLGLALLLLLFFHDCRCDPPSDPPSTGRRFAATPPPAPEALPPLPPGARTPTSPRPAYRPEPAPTHPWLDAFRLQVAARSPRLAACFEGVQAPGTLRWTTGVVPQTGRVVDHQFEPLSTSLPLTNAQTACARAALTEPPYTLEATPDDGSPPVRVSLLIEF